MSMEIRAYKSDDESAVVELWRDCGLVMPQNDPHKDIKRKTAFQSDQFLVGVIDGQIIASLMAGYEGHRGWLNYLAVSPDLRRRGLGRQMVYEAEKRLRALGCPKINLQVRISNAEAMGFYRNIGFAEDNVTSMGKRLEED
jgi:ribosomal protein S18 acetylase RimI-like enzyme